MKLISIIFLIINTALVANANSKSSRVQFAIKNAIETYEGTSCVAAVNEYSTDIFTFLCAELGEAVPSRSYSVERINKNTFSGTGDIPGGYCAINGKLKNDIVTSIQISCADERD